MKPHPSESATLTSPTAYGGQHVVIIGGGITGLSAAWELQQAAAQNPLLRYTVLEQSDRWGGKVHTEIVDNGSATPFVLEAGADAFLTRKPWALHLARELGLSDRIQSVNSQHNRTYVLHRGQPVPLPDGLQLLVPTHLLPFLRSPLFSAPGKVRALLDYVIPPRRTETDETLASFVRRRLGAEMLDKLGGTLLAGVYNGDPETQSMLATFPQFPALERDYGSLIRGMRHTQRQRVSSDSPLFISFQTGAHELIQALVAQLNSDLRLTTAVIRIEQLEEGRYRLITSDGQVLEADALILTTPAHVTGRLLAELCPTAAAQLGAIPYSGIGTAYLAFGQEDVPHPLKGFGLVIPASERRPIDGITWTSSKWNGRAPSGHVLLRVFFGGPRTRATLELSDAELQRVVRAELKTMFGISAAPVLQRVYRWTDGYPQYNLGHLERVAAAEAALPSSVYIAGSAYRGVGVPDCIRQGREAAEQAICLLAERSIAS